MTMDVTDIKPELTGDFKGGLTPIRYAKAKGEISCLGRNHYS